MNAAYETRPDGDPVQTLGLDQVLWALGRDLSVARSRTCANPESKFYGLAVKEATVELSATVTEEVDREGNLGIKWNVIGVGGSRKTKSGDVGVQKIVLTLHPVDPDKRTPVTLHPAED